MIVHASRIRGSVSQVGGGGGPSCSLPAGGYFSIIGSPVCSDYEDTAVGGSLHIHGVVSCWMGVLRDRVHQNVTYDHNALSDPDASEVVSNSVAHDISCVGNSPAVQYGDGGGRPNRVGGHASGQCSFRTYQPDPAPNGPQLPISVPR